jgi:DNA invertase Pin-like site-specific DNA recombinase
MRVALYSRVSTSEARQDVDLQLVPLRAWAEANGHEIWEYTDHASASDFVRRTGWKALLEDARAKRFEHLACWKLDRCFRSSLNALSTLEALDGLGITFSCLTQPGIDTSSPTGRLTFQILAAVGEFERSLIRERVREGLRNARRKGARLGRPPVTDRPGFSREFTSVSAELRAGRLSKRAAALRLGVSRPTLDGLLMARKSRGRPPAKKG